MKRRTILWMVVCLLGLAIPAKGAMSINKMRQNTRFLTDRMAYELNLTAQQYDDVYEVNYDFINNVRYLMDDVVRGHGYALDRYYDFLDVRNDDLRWILSNAQYRRFMAAEHFYRPIYAHNNKWQFRIFTVYTNVNFFYFGKPRHYHTYCGGHYRTHFNNVSYYKTHYPNRYRHDVYNGHFRIRSNKMDDRRYHQHDFRVASRPSGREQHRTIAPSPTRRQDRSQARPQQSSPNHRSQTRTEQRRSGEGRRSTTTSQSRQEHKQKERPARRESNTRVERSRNESRHHSSGREVKRESSRKESRSNTTGASKERGNTHARRL